MKPRLVKTGAGRSQVTVTPHAAPRAITFSSEEGGFSLTASGVDVNGRPTYGDLESALDFADYAEQKSPFWKAGLLNYAYSRADWAGMLDAVVDRWGLTPHTIDQYRSVDRRVPQERRVEGLSFSHHEAVASLPADDQTKYLERAKREHLSVSETKRVVQKEKKVRRILKGQASDLAKAQKAVVEHAHEAAALCRAIAARDCHDAEKMLTKARREMDRCEDALLKFRKAQGRQS